MTLGIELRSSAVEQKIFANEKIKKKLERSLSHFFYAAYELGISNEEMFYWLKRRYQKRIDSIL